MFCNKYIEAKGLDCVFTFKIDKYNIFDENKTYL